MNEILHSRQKVLAAVALRLSEIDNLRGISGVITKMVAPYCDSDAIVTYRFEKDMYRLVNVSGDLPSSYCTSFWAAEISQSAKGRISSRDMFLLDEVADWGFDLPCLADPEVVSALIFPLVALGELEGFVVFISRVNSAWDDDTLEWISTVMALFVGSVRRTIANERWESELAWRDKIYPIIAHDLRGSVGAMRMLIDALSLADREQDRVELFDMARKNATEAFVLLDNLLKWSRNSLHNDMETHWVEVRFLELVDTVIAYFEPIAVSKNVRLVRDFRCAEFSTRLDREMMMTILRNLIANAIKFTPQLGEVVVGVLIEEASITVWVRDTGVGMSEQDVALVNGGLLSSIRRGTGGESSTGFGLSLVGEFVALHGGQLRVSSALCEGSCFSFSIAQLC